MNYAWFEQLRSRNANWRGYVFRRTPVPGVHCFRGGRSYFRCPHTHNEKAANAIFAADEAKKYRLKIRRCRLGKNLPDDYDDFNYARRGNGWKLQRQTQYKGF